MDVLTIVLVAFFAFLIYFLPAMVASGRKHHNSTAIYVTNLLLGWTLLGWVVALVWATTSVQKTEQGAPKPANDQDPHEPAAASESKVCPFCAESIKREAIVCRYCGRDLPTAEQ